MKCPYCNQEIPDDSKFCTYCGQGLESAKPETQEESLTKTALPDGEEETKESGEPEAGNKTIAAADAEPTPGADENPQGPEAYVSPAVPEEGKKSNKKLAIGAVVVAGVAIVAAAAVALFPHKDPKTTVIDAFKSVTAEGQTSPMDELFGMTELYKKLQTESANVSMEVSVNSISDPSMASLNTGKLTMGVKQDMQNKQYSIDFGIGYADMDLASLQMYFDEKNVTMAVPELSGKAFSFNYADDLEGQIEKSPYLGQMVKESGMDINAFKEYFEYINKVSNSGGQIFDFKALWERYKEGSQAIDNLKAAMTVEKTDKKSLAMDGKEQSCDGYDVTITKDALIAFLNTSKEFFMSDETIKSDFLEYFNQVMKLSNSMSAYGVQDEMTGEQTWNEMETAFTDMIEQLEDSMGDVHMVVYVDKAGRLAAMVADTTAMVEDEQCEITLDVKLQGGYRLTANGSATLTLAVEDDEITLDLVKTGSYDDKEFTGSYEITAASGTDSFTFNYSGVYNIPDSTFHIDLGMDENGTDLFTVSTDGSVQDLEKGKAVSMIIDSAKLEVPSGYNLMIDLGGSYKVSPLEGTVDMPKGETFDIFAATETDWESVIQEINTNLWGLIMQ